MNGLMQRPMLLLGLLALVLIVLASSVAIVPETKQAVIVRFGQPVRTFNVYRDNEEFGRTGAGLIARIPFAEQIVWVDKRVIAVEMEQQQVLSTDQLRLEVDAFARFRIIDPVKMVRTAGSTERVIAQLQPILSSVLREELGKQTFQSLLTAERGAVMMRIRDGLDRQARDYGAQVIDVRIKAADLPAGALESAFASMEAARLKEATAIRAEGQKQAQIIRAEADAKAAKIYADSFGKDPQFYDFYRAMQSYDATFANPANKSGSTIILSPDNEYLKRFKEG